METLTVENLARAIHEVSHQAARIVGFDICRYVRGVKIPGEPDFDRSGDITKAMRREQARLLLQRILR